MHRENEIYIDTDALEEIAQKIPKEDFVDAQYDINKETNLTDILFILSTPRSGSTLLSDLAYKNNICIPHEYFQPFQYIPFMARRWGCIENGKLEKEKYLANLIKYRTSVNGWLGINLHGRHLREFSKFEKLLPQVNMHYVRIIRKDIFAQAVSYEIASQTDKWSSHYEVFSKANYSFKGVKDKLNKIHKQNSLINAYLKLKEINFQTFYYEDLVSDPVQILKELLPEKFHVSLTTNSELKKQSSETNIEWVKKFSTEYFVTDGFGYDKAISTGLKQNVKHLMKRITRVIR